MSDLSHIRVLHVEDSPSEAAVIRAQLAPIFKVVHVTTLAAALSIESPDCILLDLVLPDSTGVGTVAVTRSHHPHVPIVVLTGEEDRQRHLGCRVAGADAVHVKHSTDTDGLIDSLHRATQARLQKARAAECASQLQTLSDQLLKFGE